nr:hypothetical protein [Tanacetum cinerariifolium]
MGLFCESKRVWVEEVHGRKNEKIRRRYKSTITTTNSTTRSPLKVSFVKLPILKKGEYILWTMKMEQYLAHTNYALWEVILNGNSKVQMIKDEAGNEVKVPHVTAQQILARTRERKAKSTLLMAIPDEHLARFHGIKDAKTLWAAIKTIFGDNLDIDNLYNNLKVYEADIKGSSGSSSNLHNVAFISTESTNSKNELNAAYSISTATCHSSQAQGSSLYADELMFLFFANQSSSPQLDNEDLEQIDQDDLEEIDLKWQVAMLSMSVKQFYKKTIRKLKFNGKEPIGFDKTKVEYFNCHRRGHFVMDYRTARNPGNRGRDAGNAGYRGRDIGKRPTREEDEKALVVQDGLVFTTSGRIPISAAKPKPIASTSTAKQVNIGGPKQSVNFSNSRSTFHKSHSPIRRSFYNATTHSRSNSTERVNTAGSKAVSAVKETRITVVKASTGCVWRPRVNEIEQIFKDNRWICTGVDYGYPKQALRNKRIVDSVCSRHMSGNKAYLADYQEINDGAALVEGRQLI